MLRSLYARSAEAEEGRCEDMVAMFSKEDELDYLYHLESKNERHMSLYPEFRLLVTPAYKSIRPALIHGMVHMAEELNIGKGAIFLGAALLDTCSIKGTLCDQSLPDSLNTSSILLHTLSSFVLAASYVGDRNIRYLTDSEGHGIEAIGAEKIPLSAYTKLWGNYCQNQAYCQTKVRAFTYSFSSKQLKRALCTVTKVTDWRCNLATCNRFLECYIHHRQFVKEEVKNLLQLRDLWAEEDHTLVVKWAHCLCEKAIIMNVPCYYKHSVIAEACILATRFIMNITPFWLGGTICSTQADLMLCVKDVLHIWDEQSAKDWSAAVEKRSEVIASPVGVYAAQLEQLAGATQRDLLGAFNVQFAIPCLDIYAEYTSPLITEAELLEEENEETPLISEAELLEAENKERPLITEAVLTLSPRSLFLTCNEEM